MAAFHPRTFELLREALARETAQNAIDRARLHRMPVSSHSKMNEALRDRATAYPAVAADLEWLLEFMQRLTDQADRHATERATPERTTLAEQLRARGAEQAARDAEADAFHAQRRADEAEANGEHLDYDEADAVREIENEMALEAAGVERWEDL